MTDANGSSRRRNLTTWVPIVVTVAVATAGVAAWAWSQRQTDDDDEDHEGLDYGGTAEGPSSRGARPASGGAAPAPPGTEAPRGPEEEQPSWGARVAERLRRTPSPQQVFGTASKTVAAGVAAAGAAVGTALSSIREEDKAAFSDHETWSEEAEKQARAASTVSKNSGRGRRSVVVIVSAESGGEDDEDDGFEHATILSHIPKQIDFATTKLFILIYAPGLKDGALEAKGNSQPPPSLGSSYSNIGHDQAQPTEGDSKSPVLTPKPSGNPAFNAVYSHALSLVEEETMVLPFTSRNGHVYILRHLQPEVVYLQESLGGDNGSAVAQIQTWLRHDIVLVVGAESGHGGLADSESEAEAKPKVEKWWEREDRVGRGRGVVVVDSIRVHDDWARRVQKIE